MSKKSEARAERNLVKTAKNAEKSARLVARPVEQTVRYGANPAAIFGMKVSWACDFPDRDGAWSWGVNRCWTDQDWHCQILPKMKEFEKLTWGEIDIFKSDTGHKMHHFMDVEQLCSEAQDRLKDIEKHDVERLFRFRLANKPRLWGTRIAAHFEIVWYDPTHRVYPVD